MEYPRLEKNYPVHVYETGLHGRLNLHTNMSRYPKWVTDSYDLDFILNNVPLSAEINYLAESHINESIAITKSEGSNDSNVINHSIMRTSDNTELCRVRINWKKNHMQHINNSGK